MLKMGNIVAKTGSVFGNTSEHVTFRSSIKFGIILFRYQYTVSITKLMNMRNVRLLTPESFIADNAR